MSDAIITVSGLGKKYRIRHNVERQRYTALRDVIAEKARGFFKKLTPEKPGPGNHAGVPAFPPPGVASSEDFWALKDVSFEVKQGEVVGIIGRNGAGKSTLLKILSRITEPSTGRVHLKGRVASLLEVGTGFHPELTGRENVFLNGAILGMGRAEIRRKFDEIVDFSGVEKFLDTPVKRYSSGMYVRLAFAVAAHLEPEILIVDEVLAVGDAEFQKKCLGKMQAVATGGRTVLFVSHNMAAVMRLCQTGVLLNRGSVEASGKMESVVASYFNSGREEGSVFIADGSKAPSGNDVVNLVSVAVRGADGGTGPNFSSDTLLQVEITYRVLKLVRGLRIGFHLLGADGAIIFNATDMDRQGGVESGRPRHTGLFKSICTIPAGFLNRGQFSLTVGSDSPLMTNFYRENAVSFSIESVGGGNVLEENRPGLVCPDLDWKIQSTPAAG
jgi:lipopolysaccharide transport system ATP-binding protein